MNKSAYLQRQRPVIAATMLTLASFSSYTYSDEGKTTTQTETVPPSEQEQTTTQDESWIDVVISMLSPGGTKKPPP